MNVLLISVLATVTTVTSFHHEWLPFLGSRSRASSADLHLATKHATALLRSDRVDGFEVLSSPRPRTRCQATGNTSENDAGDIQDEEGKFLQLGSEITDAFGPLGLVTAGYDEEHLDLIIDACEAAIAQYRTRIEQEEGLAALPPPHLPVAILGKSDLSLTFRQVLSQLEERDCVLPADGDELLVLPKDKGTGKKINKNFNYLKYPLVLFSGLEIPALQLSLRFIESMGDRLPIQPMVAMAVPKAMDKPVSQLLEELEGDHVGVMEDQQSLS